MSQSQIFISYSYDDVDIAKRIGRLLRDAGANVWLDEHENSAGDDLAAKITNEIGASDYLLILLSPSSVNSNWVQKEWGTALSNDFVTRDITIIPVLLKDCKIPFPLIEKHIIDLRDNWLGGIDLIVRQVGIAPKIDFSSLEPKEFESLIADLLNALGFSNIATEQSITGKQVDLKAEFKYKDPFDLDKTEFWVVEIKFYRKNRLDITSLQQMADYLHSLPTSYHGLLVTNGHLTSAARHLLQLKASNQKIDLRVLGGTDLKRLLLKHPKLIEKYFNKDQVGSWK